MEYIEIPCCKGPGFKISVKGLIHQEKSVYQEIAVYDTEPFGRCLILDGDIQTAESDHEVYDKAILKRLSAGNRSLLILGGGDGCVAEMALKLNPQIEITMVELDGAVVSTCKTHLKQNVFDHPNVKLVVDDAFHFMEKAGNCGYNGIVCDLTDFPVGYNDGKFRGFYEKVFTLSAKILKPGGWIAVYAGNNADILAELLGKEFSAIEQRDISIPSFGETCYFLYGERANDESGKVVIEVLKEATDDIVNRIIELGKVTYPISSNGNDIAEYYADLNNPEYINIVLKRRNEIVGYLLAVPQKAACDYLKDIDPLIINRSDIFYVDAIQITPGVSNAIGFKLLLKKLIEEASYRGINKFSMHTRKSNGLSRVILKLFPTTKILRTIHSFEGTEEPFDYIEGEYTADARITIEK